MEAMSQDAIDEMVENAFAVADTDRDGKLSFHEFAEWVCLEAKTSISVSTLSPSLAPSLESMEMIARVY